MKRSADETHAEQLETLSQLLAMLGDSAPLVWPFFFALFNPFATGPFIIAHERVGELTKRFQTR